MRVGTVSGIFRYPVKSMGGESLDEVELGTQGLPGDRSWAVRDEVNGGIRGAKKIGGLMELSARFTTPPAATGSSPAEITFPDGSKAATGDPDVSDRISEAVDHPVSLWRGFEELPRDPSVMRALVTETGGILGVYASVAEPGRVGAGDSVELLD